MQGVHLEALIDRVEQPCVAHAVLSVVRELLVTIELLGRA
jgi:hypothetical protein